MWQQKLTKAIPDSKSSLYEQAVRDSEHWKGVRATMEQQMQNDRVWRDKQLLVPSGWQLMTNGSTTALRSLQLRMPNRRYGGTLNSVHTLFALLVRPHCAWQIQSCDIPYISAVAYALNSDHVPTSLQRQFAVSDVVCHAV